MRFKGADGRWHGAPAKARTKPAARLEALERERLARQQCEGLAPSADNMRRTFGELMNLSHERYGSRLRSQTIKLSVEKHLRPALGKLLLGGAATALPALLNSKMGELSPSSLNHLRAYCHRLYAVASMLRRLVDGPEPRQPTRAAEVQGAEAQAPDGCGGRRAARPGRARARGATALRDGILSWPPPR